MARRALAMMTLLGGVLVAAALGGCADLAREDQAWQCAGDGDCLDGQVCVDGGCRPPGDGGGGGGSCDGDEAVCQPGAAQQEACGRCGRRERVCGDTCAWGAWGACEGEGVCAPGAESEGPCGACGTQPRVCNEACVWEVVGACEEAGDCAPGDEDTLACEQCGVRRRACGEDCAWGPWGLCEDQGACVVGDGETEPCGACGTRARVCGADCSWSEWGACDGEGECAAGAEESEACGGCGVRRRQCDEACVWGAWSDCQDGGECVPAEEQTEACGDCGERRRVCASTCVWEEWSPCEGEGPCEALTEESVPCPECGVRERSCTAACRWTDWTPCAGEPTCVPGETCAAHGVCTGRIVEVPAVAAFAMGSPDGEGYVDERPEHPVAVGRFAMDRLEVTSGEYVVFLNNRGNVDGEGRDYVDLDDPDAPIAFSGDRYTPRAVCQATPGGARDRSCADHPVYEVSWYGARDYCAWKGGRLPSEAEWERAAAGGADHVYPWGDEPPSATRANCDEAACDDGFVLPAPVGSFPGGAATTGIEDLAGNVLEWVADCYHPGYAGAPTDGSAWEDDPDCTTRIARGGHVSSEADDLRAARRFPFAPTRTPDTPIGFRCVYDM